VIDGRERIIRFVLLSWDFKTLCATELNDFFFNLWSVTSLEDAYEALRVFEIIGFEEKKTHVSGDTCQKVLENLNSASPLKDLFYALKVNAILKCDVNREALKVPLYFCVVGHSLSSL